MISMKAKKCKNIFLIVLTFVVYERSIGQSSVTLSADSVSICDTFFGSHIICDEFRWLEESGSEEVKSWVANQMEYSKDYLQGCRSKSYSSDYLNQYSDINSDYALKCGKYYFTFYRTSDFQTGSIGIRTTINSIPRILINSSNVSKKDLVSINNLYSDVESKYLAYEFSRNGSDTKEIKVIDLKTERELPDHIVDARYGQICWFGNGFCYTIWDRKSDLDAVGNARLYYHRLGSTQSEDQLIYKRDDAARNKFRYSSSSDGKYLFVSDFNAKTGKTNLYMVQGSDSLFRLNPVFRNLDKSFVFLDMIDQSIIGYTIDGGVSCSIVRFELSSPYEWKLLIPSSDDRVMTDVLRFEDRIVMLYMKNQKPVCCVYDLEGSELYELGFPAGSAVSFRHDKASDDGQLFFSVGDYTTPDILYTLDLYSFKLSNHNSAKVNYDFSDFVKEQVNYLSGDGTEVSMTLVYDKSKRKNSPVPCVLEAYGGFNSINQPSFDPGVVYLIRTGGIYAFANIRGGGDKGIEWSKAGRGLNKQNSFDDFIAAAEFLIENNYTIPSMLGTVGYSNGGLVVAASAIQRPDLFKAVVPVVAPLDMIRFEKFTVGSLHTSEYGTVSDSTSFTRLLKFSPLHNIKDGINYPSMLMITAENDERVPPFHAYKFTGAMKKNAAQTNPVLLWSSRNAGHYGPLLADEYSKLKSSIFGFLLHEMLK